MKLTYKNTLVSCFIGYIVQAITINFIPLLFVTFQRDYGIPLSQITLLVTINFSVQLLIDITAPFYVDKLGYRPCIVAAHGFSAAGLLLLTVLPDLLSPFAGLLISVITYAIGSGLIEVLISPITESCPTNNKEKAMSLLHSFYCWGSLGVVLFSTLFFFAFGIENWRVMACVWALVPIANIYNFATCPIEHLVEDGKGMSIGQLCKTPIFWIAVVLMACAGASELSMAQWASAYAESALGLSKTLGDLAGPCMFAITMGISRVFYGKYGEKVDLTVYMLGSGALCLVCYVLASMTANPVWGLVGCIVCGFSVGIMWPGTLSISSARMPMGGTALFALLAMAGDLGGAFGPSIVGYVTQAAGDNLRMGLRVGCIFPILLMVGLVLMRRMGKAKE